MFCLREFLKKGLLDAVGKQPAYWIVLNAAGWLEKGALLEEDLKEINDSLEAFDAEKMTEYADENIEEADCV